MDQMEPSFFEKGHLAHKINYIHYPADKLKLFTYFFVFLSTHHKISTNINIFLAHRKKVMVNYTAADKKR